jgi:hypothetical protein
VPKSVLDRLWQDHLQLVQELLALVAQALSYLVEHLVLRFVAAEPASKKRRGRGAAPRKDGTTNLR